jgi:hypothetical protein
MVKSSILRVSFIDKGRFLTDTMSYSSLDTNH